MTIPTLIKAATLKGYLIGLNAPQEILSIAEQMVETAKTGLTVAEQPVQRIRNEDVVIPEAALKLAESIRAVSASAPSHDESRFNGPETAQAEEEGDITATSVADEPKDVPVSTGGRCLRIVPMA
jgi:hypothetical protein